MSTEAREMLAQKTQEQAVGVAARNFLGLTSDTLAQFEQAIDRALPKTTSDLNAQRIIQIATTLIQQDAKLKECTAKSVLGCVMQAAILGLNPLPQMNECFLIPRSERRGSNIKVCTFQIGYKGWINLYYGCKAVKVVRARVVCAKDEFEFRYGLDEVLTHVPNEVPAADGSNVTHVYAIVELVTGGRTFVVLTKGQIDALMLRGAGGDRGRIGPAWKADYGAMSLAKALKEIKRFIPLSGSVSAASGTDGHALDPSGFNADGVYDIPILGSGEDDTEDVPGDDVDTEELFNKAPTKLQPHPSTE